MLDGGGGGGGGLLSSVETLLAHVMLPALRSQQVIVMFDGGHAGLGRDLESLLTLIPVSRRGARSRGARPAQTSSPSCLQWTSLSAT